MGGEYRWYTSPTAFLQNSRGLYIYSTLSNLLNDQVPANQQLQGIGSGTFVGNASNYSLFFQDDFKLTPRLTINAGLRYEFFGNPAGARKQALNALADLAADEVLAELWESLGARVTTLDPAVVSSSLKSLGSGGTETIVVSNATPGVYYIAVKSEDQQAAEYAILGVFSLLPFSENHDGNRRNLQMPPRS